MDRAELIDRLRDMELLELLDEHQLAWMADHGVLMDTPAGTELFGPGSDQPGLHLLVEGEMAIVRVVNGTPTVMASNTAPGAWSGAIPYVDDGASEVSVRTPVDSVVLHLPHDAFVDLVRKGIPIFHHLLRGVREGALRFTQRISGEERLASLGRLSAGLAHELNNPASAARRGAARLPAAIWDLQAVTVRIVHATGPSPELRARFKAIEQDLLDRAEQATTLGPLERGDREDEILELLEDADVDDAEDHVDALVDGGADAEWLQGLVDANPDLEAGPLLSWIARMSDVRQLIREIEISAGRISDLVGSIKAYSYVDREGGARLDLHAGLDATLAVLRHKLGDVEVVRDYDLDLPEIDGHAGELNQVWTNLVDNALAAMDGSGTITISTRLEAGTDSVRIEISDTGPGIPVDDRMRIFDAFFTTKAMGEGTGLGLDLVRRVVVDGHAGTVHVEEASGGGARFVVHLPVGEPG